MARASERHLATDPPIRRRAETAERRARARFDLKTQTGSQVSHSRSARCSFLCVSPIRSPPVHRRRSARAHIYRNHLKKKPTTTKNGNLVEQPEFLCRRRRRRRRRCVLLRRPLGWRFAPGRQIGLLVSVAPPTKTLRRCPDRANEERDNNARPKKAALPQSFSLRSVADRCDWHRIIIIYLVRILASVRVVLYYCRRRDNFFTPPKWTALPDYLQDCYFYCYSRCLKVRAICTHTQKTTRKCHMLVTPVRRVAYIYR